MIALSQGERVPDGGGRVRGFFHSRKPATSFNLRIRDCARRGLPKEDLEVPYRASAKFRYWFLSAGYKARKTA